MFVRLICLIALNFHFFCFCFTAPPPHPPNSITRQLWRHEMKKRENSMNTNVYLL